MYHLPASKNPIYHSDTRIIHKKTKYVLQKVLYVRIRCLLIVKVVKHELSSPVDQISLTCGHYTMTRAMDVWLKMGYPNATNENVFMRFYLMAFSNVGCYLMVSHTQSYCLLNIRTTVNSNTNQIWITPVLLSYSLEIGASFTAISTFYLSLFTTPEWLRTVEWHQQTHTYASHHVSTDPDRQTTKRIIFERTVCEQQQ